MTLLRTKGSALVFRDDQVDQGDGEAGLSRGSVLAGPESLCVGLSRPHREPGRRDGAAAPPPLAHHRRDGPGQEVRGPGVVGEQPVLAPGQIYEYTSGTPLEHAVRHHGRQLRDGDGRRAVLRRGDSRLLARQPAPAGARSTNACATEGTSHGLEACRRSARCESARRPSTRPSREEAEAAVRLLLRWAGDDPDREGLKGTPARVVRAFEEFFAGYGERPGRAPAAHLRGDRRL